MSTYGAGEHVLVTIEENGYWKDLRKARYIKHSANGRVGVKFYASERTRYFKAENVRKRNPK